MRSLRTQLLISHLLLVLVMGIVMSASIASLFSLSGTVDRMYENNLKSMRASEGIRDGLSKEVTSAAMFLTGQRNAPMVHKSAAGILKDNIRNGREAANEALDLNLVRRLEIYIKDLETAMAALAAAPNREAAIASFGHVRAIADNANGVAAKLSDVNYEATRQEKNSAAHEAFGASWRSVVYTFLALGIAILLASRMMRLALTPLAMLAKQAEVIGSGELDRKIQLDRHDEIGALADSFNEMAGKLADVRRMETRRLRRAEKMTDSAFESLYDPVIVTDAKGRIVHLNRAAEKLFGPAPESPRMPVVEHIGDERIVRAIRKAIEQQTVSATEDETSIVPIKLEGGDRTYRLRATPMKEDDGTLLGSVVVLEDITHLRQLDRLKTDFIGVASHELRTPITSLLLSNELLEEGAAGQLNPQQRQLVDAQKQDLQRLERLTRELLDLTRLEAGQTPPRFEMIPAKHLVESAVQSLKSQADQKGIRLVVEAPDDLPPVRVDRSQITRVLVNLLNNAIRHTPAGGTITVRATPSKNQVTFEVADTGEGIPSEYLAKIFDRFVQVPGATQGGAGLGLSIAQRIVKAHGGVMQVGSELGKGSAFRFSLSTNPEGDGEEAT
ncbi:MAG: two-component system, NtrC family, sensor histidine kinase KinB [Fimbriimonadaceae bacterium]|nr:two-component system, NtrC family, sensor histidine kinase KinB [Fimbriimonadaceae bacterium]